MEPMGIYYLVEPVKYTFLASPELTLSFAGIVGSLTSFPVIEALSVNPSSPLNDKNIEEEEVYGKFMEKAESRDKKIKGILSALPLLFFTSVLFVLIECIIYRYSSVEGGLLWNSLVFLDWFVIMLLLFSTVLLIVKAYRDTLRSAS